MKRFLILLLLISSCKKETYYYPSKQFFEEHHPEEMDINQLHYQAIVDSLRNQLYKKKRHFFQFEESDQIYKISPLAYTGGYIKERNILEIVEDSLWSSEGKVSIKELGKQIQRHYENNGKEESLPVSFKKAFLQVNLAPQDASEKLKSRLMYILQVYNRTNFKNKERVNLDIMLNYYLDKIYPTPIAPPPPIPLKIVE